MNTIKHTLIELLQSKNLTIKCACVSYDNEVTTQENFNLKIGYSCDSYDAFLNFLDRKNSSYYDATIWLTNGGWVQYLYDYDNNFGYWQHNEIPKIPNNLK